MTQAATLTAREGLTRAVIGFYFHPVKQARAARAGALERRGARAARAGAARAARRETARRAAGVKLPGWATVTILGRRPRR